MTAASVLRPGDTITLKGTIGTVDGSMAVLTNGQHVNVAAFGRDDLAIIARRGYQRDDEISGQYVAELPVGAVLTRASNVYAHQGEARLLNVATGVHGYAIPILSYTVAFIPGGAS